MRPIAEASGSRRKQSGNERVILRVARQGSQQNYRYAVRGPGSYRNRKASKAAA